MLYPRVNKDDRPISDDQMVGHREHLLLNHRLIFLQGQIGVRCLTCGANEGELPNLLLALDSLGRKPIRIIINSPGGDLDSMFTLYDTLRLLSSPVETYGRYCASASAVLLAVGRKRYVSPHAKILLHLPSGRGEGDTRDFEIIHKQMQTYKDKIVAALQECGVKRLPQEILTDIDRDFWLEPEEAIAYGLADEIMTPKIMRRWLRGK